MNADDRSLLRQYAERHSQDAFTALVNRHVNLVYSAALRIVRAPQLAEEAAQSVFTDLARSVGKLKPDTILTAWLYRVACRTAVDVVRREARRRNREQKVVEMATMNSESTDWTQIESLLDEGMQTLDETDRAAILLRYFENKSLREVGERLGTSEDAAQKRVSRAVERLREFFTKRGVAIGTGAVAVAISANAIQAAPVGLATSISAAAVFAGTTLATTATATITKAITMTTLQKAIIGGTLAVAVGTGIFEAHQNSKLRNENESLQQRVTELRRKNEDLSNRLTAAEYQSSPVQSLPSEQSSELLRLRGEVGELRRQKTELENRLAIASNPNPEGSNQQSVLPAPLPTDYPKTADAAAQTIFETWGRGDWEAFFTNFDVEGGREFWDQAINDQMKSNLLDMEVVSIGEPTNSFGSNMWLVPYTIRVKDGSEKSLQLHLAQDPQTKRWILKGGF